MNILRPKLNFDIINVSCQNGGTHLGRQDLTSESKFGWRKATNLVKALVNLVSTVLGI